MEKFVKSKQLFFHKMTSWKGVSGDTLKFHFTQKVSFEIVSCKALAFKSYAYPYEKFFKT